MMTVWILFGPYHTPLLFAVRDAEEGSVDVLSTLFPSKAPPGGAKCFDDAAFWHGACASLRVRDYEIRRFDGADPIWVAEALLQLGAACAAPEDALTVFGDALTRLLAAPWKDGLAGVCVCSSSADGADGDSVNGGDGGDDVASHIAKAHAYFDAADPDAIQGLLGLMMRYAGLDAEQQAQVAATLAGLTPTYIARRAALFAEALDGAELDYLLAQVRNPLAGITTQKIVALAPRFEALGQEHFGAVFAQFEPQAAVADPGAPDSMGSLIGAHVRGMTPAQRDTTLADAETAAPGFLSKLEAAVMRGIEARLEARLGRASNRSCE